MEEEFLFMLFLFSASDAAHNLQNFRVLVYNDYLKSLYIFTTL